ncbi:uncharacterized protein [Palaemon carinicauda]|uniref:uncharacterized protein n=1 Tax=Palaemon carinicauda TaxID=392227 RepID=UPI0035B5CCF7
MKSYIGIVFFLCAVLGIASALECYECTQVCKEVDCDGSCMTITIMKGNEISTVQQLCWKEKMEDKCTEEEDDDDHHHLGIKSKICYCNDDGCNSSSTRSLFGLLLFMPIIIQWLSL